MVKDIALNPEKYQNDPRAVQFQHDPALALLNESENLVEEQHKQKIQITKVMVDKEKGMDEKLEVIVPPEHIDDFRRYISILRAAREKAIELKRKKDEMQVQLIYKALESPWKKYDPEDTGYLAKDQTSELAQVILATMGKKEIFDKPKFDHAFDVFMIGVDITSGAISQDDLIKIQQEVQDKFQEQAQDSDPQNLSTP